MGYRVEIPLRVQRVILGWQLPDPVLVEIHMRLREDLKDSPALSLERTRQPFDGMSYRFSMIDPDNRLCVHHFVFQVFYRQDEEQLTVARGGYARTVGV
jgi:hypothetical protein